MFHQVLAHFYRPLARTQELFITRSISGIPFDDYGAVFRESEEVCHRRVELLSSLIREFFSAVRFDGKQIGLLNPRAFLLNILDEFFGLVLGE